RVGDVTVSAAGRQAAAAKGLLEVPAGWASCRLPNGRGSQEMPASPTLPARDPTGTPVARVRGGDWCVLAAEGVRPRRLLRRDVPGTRGAARALSQDTRAARRDESGT